MDQKRILLVDDEPVLLDMMFQFFEMKGYQVLRAEDAEAAHRVVRRNRGNIDAAVLDYRLPGTSGSDLFQSLVEDDPRLFGRCVLISGDGLPTALPDGMQYLPKPFDLRTMLEIVEDIARPGR